MGKEFPKHDAGQTKACKRKPQPAHAPIAPETTVVLRGPQQGTFDNPGSMQHDINHVAGMSGIEESLDSIASGLYRITSDDHAISISSGGCVPVKITFSDHDGDTDLTYAIQRIADSLAKLAGLNLTPLEPEWSRHAAGQPDSAANGTEA